MKTRPLINSSKGHPLLGTCRKIRGRSRGVGGFRQCFIFWLFSQTVRFSRSETKGEGDLNGDSVLSSTATARSVDLGEEGKQRPFHRWLSSTKENADVSLYRWLSETGNNGVPCG